jgi:hypothetical protein
MRLIKGSLAGLVLAAILALAPTAASAQGGGGGGFGGGRGGGHFGGGGGHFGGGHFIGQNYVNPYRNAYVPNTPLATVHQFARREYL